MIVKFNNLYFFAYDRNLFAPAVQEYLKKHKDKDSLRDYGGALLSELSNNTYKKYYPEEAANREPYKKDRITLDPKYPWFGFASEEECFKLWSMFGVDRI